MFSAIHRHRRGIYATIIFHLCLLTALMGIKINAVQQQTPSAIEIDFEDTQEELLRQKAQQLEIQRELAQELYNHAAAQSEYLRNAIVNEESPKENRDKVFDENDELQRRIEATYQMMRQSSDDAALPSPSKSADAKPYAGPSVLSYLVQGRQAAYLPVPAYKCEAGGRVVVAIVVSENGDVLEAQVHTSESAVDECLRMAARDAALRSKFNVAAGMRQSGSITYQFIPQYRQ
jgi:TonB family protein